MHIHYEDQVIAEMLRENDAFVWLTHTLPAILISVSGLDHSVDSGQVQNTGSTLCKQNAKFVNVEQVVHIVTSVI
jgi:hypothetical protein